MKKIIFFILVSLLAYNGCKDDPASPGGGIPPQNEVWMTGNSFSPSTITVAPGTTIRWVNKDGVSHTVTSSSASLAFESGTIGNNGTFSFKFDSVGTFPYFCRFHSGMTGRVVVQ